MHRARWLVVLAVVGLMTACLCAQEVRTTAPQLAGEAVPEGVARFKFAILADFHGGQPKGSTVPADTIKEINLFDPDFTISVGDFIKGYNENQDEIKTQRDEADAILGKLKRPFYYVFGNHDSTNPKMEETLRKRYGSPWYSFTYRNCHFIVLFTEGRNAAGVALDDFDADQMAWLKRDMAANPNADQYFIFMHKPPKYMASWDKVEELFDGKILTVFAGHEHWYSEKTHKGHTYVVLATSGGSIKEKGFWQGSFYHYIVVSVTGKEASIAVVRSGAVIPHDLLNEKLLEQLDALRARSAELVYQVPKDALEVDGDLTLDVENPLETPMIGTIDWVNLPDSPWKVEPSRTEFVVEPAQKSQLKFHLKYPADPFGPNPAPTPGYTLVIRSGRPEDAHTAYDRGRDEVVNVRGQLKVDKWPYMDTIGALRKGMEIERIAPGDKPLTATRSVKVENRLATPMTVALAWKGENPGWTVKPETSQLLLPPHQIATADFEIACTATGVEALPVPALTLTATVEGQTVLTETRLLPIDMRGVLANYLPVAKVPPLSADPKIDGVLDEPTWAEAVMLSGFMDMQGLGQAPVKTEVRIGRGRTGMYVGITCYDPDMAHLTTQERPRDGQIWKDDFVELFIDTAFDHLTYYHFGVNASGTMYDEKNRDASWEGRWQAAVKRGEDRWTTELFIPWTDLGGPPAADVRWGFNVARRRPGRLPEPSYTAWSPTLRPNSHVPERFGILVFP